MSICQSLRCPLSSHHMIPKQYAKMFDFLVFWRGFPLSQEYQPFRYINDHSLVLTRNGPLSLFSFLFLLAYYQILQNDNPLLLQRIDLHLILVPQCVASGTRLVLPPGIGAPPPPLPVPAVVLQPSPILYVFFVDLSMALFQVRVYLLVYLSDLGSHYGAQSFLQKGSTLLADRDVLVDLGDRKFGFAIFAFCSVLFRFLCHFL